jgi:hypothetical protein
MLRELAIEVDGTSLSSPLSCVSGIGGVGDPAAAPCKLDGRPRPRDEGREYEVDGENDVDARPRYPSVGGVPGLALTPVAPIAGLLNKLCNLGRDSPLYPGLAPAAVMCVNDRPDCERYEFRCNDDGRS